MADWSVPSNHARVLLGIAHDPGVRLRDIAPRTGVAERTAYGIVTDLTEVGYVVKHKDGSRNRYQIQPTCRFAGRCQCLTAGDSQSSAKPWQSSPASSSA